MSDELNYDGANQTQASEPAVATERTPYDVAMERVEAIRAEVAQLRQKRDEASNRMLKLQEEETILLQKHSVSHEHDHIANQKAIMAHLDRQKAARMERAGRHQRAVASGYSAEDLRGKSAIDAAHARNTSRGAQRPNIG